MTLINDNLAHLVARSLPFHVRHTLERLSRHHYDVWIVGGALRDTLLGITPKDWDLASSASPQHIMGLFPHVVPLGIRHGTVQILVNQLPIEHTTLPCSGITGIHADLSRRDFTVNALALSFPEWSLLDPHDGASDLAAGRLRAVGNPRARFSEDPLRTLRAGRFVSTHRLWIQGDTFQAICSEAEGLDRVAVERIREEVLKMLLGEQVVEAFQWMRRGGVLQRILPELLEGYGQTQEPFYRLDVYHHILHTVENCPARVRVRLAALFHDLAKPRISRLNPGECGFPSSREASASLAAQVMKRWHMANREIREIQLLVHHHVPRSIGAWSGGAVRRLISSVGLELLEDLQDLAHADRLSMTNQEEALQDLEILRSSIEREVALGRAFSISDLAVSGADVMRILSINPGPLVGRILRKLREAVLEYPELNERKILMDFLMKAYHKEIS